MELSPMIGVDVSDLHHAARAEVKRIIQETKVMHSLKRGCLLGS